ncbi:CDGSH iron-sulfur domain-containing protein, partial [Kitasatospora sp. NPDC005748]|uniref:CDGSH iron-sulfur domain-containing protein n=1 Tax=Kitasatospora sp. NPDC005748 TaxID=3157063 RepID=UPI0033E4E77F
MSGSGEPRAADFTRVTIVAGGLLLVEGHVEVTLPDGTVRRSERPVVALCACRRSRRYPFCDTSPLRRRAPRPDSVPVGDHGAEHGRGAGVVGEQALDRAGEVGD